jgi:signal recognition particle receptor subunit beta
VTEHTLATVLFVVLDGLAPMLPAARVRQLREAVDRARAGQVRVLVLGETKRGKSTLVNRLFDIDLLPTGVLPLTAVTTTVTVGGPPSAEVGFLDGSTRPIEPSQIAAVVTQQHNPDNVRRVDRVALVALSRRLPVGTEVVDTPGTGSIHSANTAESSRARSTVDIAVLVVSADPPVSAAEIALVRDVMRTAAAALVVINKIDLVGEGELAAVAGFTRQAVTEAVGADVPVLATSLRDRGVADVAEWLTDRINQHGAQDAASSTARALRREASTVLDRLRVERELLNQTEGQHVATVAALEAILHRAHNSAETATDHVHGAARRALARLNSSHADEVTAALKATRAELGDQLTGPGTPEEQSRQLRGRLADLTSRQCASWFDRIATELGDALRAATDTALTQLGDDLARARQAAEHTLDLRLADIEPLSPTPPPHPPRLDLGDEFAWRELVSSTIAAHLPAAIRRRRLQHQLRDWAEVAVSQPFGRARATLHSWLDQTARTSERDLAAVWRGQLAALEHGIDEANRHRRRDTNERTTALSQLFEQISTAQHALTELDAALSATAQTRN